MPLLSVLTVTHAAGATFMAETLESVRAQALPEGWDLEWVVQEDGPESELRDIVAKDGDWVRYSANGARLGIALSRNFALSRVSGRLVQNLDSDDLLLPGGLAALIASFDDPTIHWAVGQADDLLPDGSRKAFPPYLPLGRLSAGEANRWAEEYGGNWPVHCAGLMIRTASLRAIGGWGGTPYDDDLVMFAALSELTDGWCHERVTWLYRQHAGQTVRDPQSKRWSELGRRIAIQRAHAIRSTSVKLSHAADPVTSDLVIGPPMKQDVRLDHRND